MNQAAAEFQQRTGHPPGVGEEGIHATEETPLRPVSFYGRLKVDAERVLLDAGNVVSFRLATAFGVSPRMRLDLLVNDLTHRAYHDRHIALFESHFKRNFVHVRDITRAFWFGIEHYDAMRGHPFNVGLSDANLSKLELCHKIQTHLPECEISMSDVGKDPDQRNYIVSNRKIESLGFSTRYSLDVGIKELIKSYGFLPVQRYRNA